MFGQHHNNYHNVFDNVFYIEMINIVHQNIQVIMFDDNQHHLNNRHKHDADFLIELFLLHMLHSQIVQLKENILLKIKRKLIIFYS